MRKSTRRPNPTPKLSGSPRKPALRLTQETIRTLAADELPLVAGGCPTGSWPTLDGSSAQGC
ncbi:MAG TPA: hypothetical protein VF469_02135 [Kofleriaceae bacterium]